MPAAAVIPAPITYTKVVTVKKLLVGFLLRTACPPSGCVYGSAWASFGGTFLHLTVWRGIQNIYFEEIRVSQAGACLEYIRLHCMVYVDVHTKTLLPLAPRIHLSGS